MFLSHFNMTNHPFCEKPPIDWILNDDRFDQAAARLNFFQEQGDVALILGQTGIGKSSLIRIFKQSIQKNRYRILYLHLTHVTPGSFLRLIVTKLGETPRLGKDRLFLQIIDRLQENETETILVIDEAHLVPSQALIDLRLLISSADESRLPFKILLSGQEGLASLLNRSVHTDLQQRICVRCRLQALSKSQTALYIDHRLRCASAGQNLFDSEAKTMIHDYSGGVPRQINNIATACIINAASKNLQAVNEQLVNETMTEFRLV
ncbi:MAG: AAA family ATPase [Desulfobacula sp.]|nr:AAA family ATPase [Desulfobacula sp.]